MRLSQGITMAAFGVIWDGNTRGRLVLSVGFFSEGGRGDRRERAFLHTFGCQECSGRA